MANNHVLRCIIVQKGLIMHQFYRQYLELHHIKKSTGLPNWNTSNI
ncbi:hypothetical protein ES705_10804 [subsurface metagenome]